jgi:homoprotocatechuate degradation regulator HpaR
MLGKNGTGKSEELGLVPIRETLPILLVRAREVLLSFWRDSLSDFGFTEQQWRVLRVTAELGPLDISRLSAETALHMPSVTRILQALEERGYVTRRRDEKDSRRSWIDVTQKARTVLSRASARSNEIYDEINQKFDSRQMSELIKLLDTFTKIKKD